jgi:hypothetical protein
MQARRIEEERGLESLDEFPQEQCLGLFLLRALRAFVVIILVVFGWFRHAKGPLG